MTPIYNYNLELFLEANELAGANGSAVTSFTDLSGKGRHLTASANKPLIKTNAVNGKKSVIWDGSKNPLVWTGDMTIRCGFLVVKCDGNFTGDFKGILSSPANFGILTGIGGSNIFYDFLYSRYEYRLNDRIYPKTAAPAPIDAFGIIFFRFWEHLTVEGIQLAQDRTDTASKADIEVALLALYNRDFCESKIKNMFDSIAYSYQLPLAKVFPFQGSKGDEVITSKRVLSDDQPEPVLRVKVGERQKFDLNFSDRKQAEKDAAHAFWKANYPLKTFIYRDYNPTPPEDTIVRIPVPSDFQRGGANNDWTYSFEATESIVLPDYTIPAVAPTIPNEDFTPPSVPEFNSVIPQSSTEMFISYVFSTDDSGVDHYELRYRVGAEAMGDAFNIGNPGNYTHTPLTPLTQYTYQIRAVDVNGNISGWSEEMGATTPDEKLLDGISSTVWGAYSFNKLYADYAGAAVRVRRTSDNTETDIGFDGDGALDIAAANAFGANLLIAKWYDQSGNARDLTGLTAARPLLDATDIAAHFTGSQYFEIPDMSALTAGEIAIKYKAAADPPAGFQNELYKIGTHGSSVAVPYSDGNIYDGFGSTVRKDGITKAVNVASAYRVYQVYSAANDWANYLEGTLLHSTATNTVGFNATPLLGAGSGFYVGKIKAVILFSQKCSGGDRTTVQAGL